MAGFAPFGRDDQPLLDVKIVGGKRVEIAVDQYGKPLKSDNKTKLESKSRFSRTLSEKRNVVNSKTASAPPWIRGETPPKKILKPLEVSPASTRQSTRSVDSISGSPVVLPPISSKRLPDSDKERLSKDSSELLHELQSYLHGFDAAQLKDVYLHFTGLDSTFTGFVDVGQVEEVFLKCRVPISGRHLDALTSKFMSARRPNWVNYEQMLKYINEAVKKEGKMGYFEPNGNHTATNSGSKKWNSTEEQEISLKPNQISPRRINDGSTTGRQSAMLVKHAFQDRQDAHLLVEMEKLLKQVQNINELIWSLKETLNDGAQNNNTIISTEKLKSLCLRHHLPFNGSLMDRILDKFDIKRTGKIDWTEFMVFLERALPLTSGSASSHKSSRSQSQHNTVETPPSQPSWETRQPLQALSKRRQVIPKAAALEQEEMFDTQKKILDQQLKEQSHQLTEILHKQQYNLDRRQKALQTDHIAEYEHIGSDIDRGLTPGNRGSQEQQELDQKHKKLLQQQYELTEQKRKINEEQEELERFARHGEGDFSENTKDSRVKSFLRLANALFLYDSGGRGFLAEDIVRRMITNYNLIYRLDFSSEIIEDAIDTSSTGEGMVSVDRVLDELKEQL